ncbi:MAG TPA: alpha-D-ribose 1-methylphosphonate 5-triphosphate diphosphatase [Burkholderiales bacterium]|nr:alpha-D-ribose 1-methylphosphonate 5-triphosphate diphosphatase [Burkholderiales bacterium]
MAEQLITNARMVLAREVVIGTARIDGGLFIDIQPGRTQAPAAEDWQSDYLIPGQVELHTDNLEKHLEPRPGVRWPAISALLTHDAQVCAAGITTVLDAMGVGDFDARSIRAVGLEEAADALRHARDQQLLRAEHLLHMRCELACDNMLEVVTPFLNDPNVRLVSLMDHTPGQRQWMDIEQFRIYTQRNQRWSDEYLAEVVRERQAMQARNAKRNRDGLLAMCRDRHIPLASHDDTVAEHIAEALEAGITISEFPTSVDAAREARKGGLAIIMGAPNLVRGRSHSGNVSALDLARLDLLDCLSSDYVPHSLLQGAFVLRDEAGWSLPKAINAVTRTPAQMVGLHDRGEIAPGKRADFIRVRETRAPGQSAAVPVSLGTWREGRRVS